jgi:hypothetical protein
MDESIAQILAFLQHEDHHHQHDAGGGERLNQRSQPGREPPQALDLFGSDDDGVAAAPLVRGARVLDVFLNFFERLLHLLNRAARAHPLHVDDLLSDIGAVGRQGLRQFGELLRHRPSGTAEDDKGRDHDRADGRRTPDVALQKGDRRCKDECEQDGNAERHQDGLGPVEDGDNEHAPCPCHPPHVAGSFSHVVSLLAERWVTQIQGSVQASRTRGSRRLAQCTTYDTARLASACLVL